MFRHVLLSLVLLLAASSGICGEIIKIPYRPDPPISIDGNLQEWATVPLARQFTSKEQVVFQPDKWRGPQDLSGTVRMAWREEGLYIAVQVNDDVFRNSGSGYDMFKGDHLELFVDITPEGEPARTEFGKGQFHFGISPGDLNDARPQGAFGKVNPEVYRFFPSAQTVIDAAVAAQKTSAGYDIEVLIPWGEFEISPPVKGKALKIEVAISDCDSVQMQQEKMMTISTDTWKFRERNRLVTAVLADSDGNVDYNNKTTVQKAITPIEIFKEIKIQPKNSERIIFVATQLPENLSPVLFIRARLDTPKNSGDTESLTLALNGTLIAGDRLVNKTAEMLSRDGDSAIKIYNKYGFRIPYAPSYKEANLPFESGNRDARFDSKEPRTDFELDLSGLLCQGENVLTIGNLHPSITATMHLADCAISFRPKKIKEIRKIIPASECFYPGKDITATVNYQILPKSRIEIKTGKNLYTVSSYFSVPGGKWETESNKYFSLTRKITERNGIIVVNDSFANLTDKNLGIIQRHEVNTPSQETKYYLNGLLRPAGMTGYVHSSNVTSFAGSNIGGIGLAPLNDAFKIHGESYLVNKGGIGFCDQSLVIGPKASYTAEWIIAANTTGSYWDFINSLRRFLDVNFKINGSMAFLHIYPPESEHSAEMLKKFFKYKSAFFVSHGDPFIKVFKDTSVIFAKGSAVLDDGLFIQPKGHPAIKELYSKWREASPNIKILSYFHCFIDSHPKAREMFPEDRVLNKSGNQAVYGKEFYPLFYPTLTNKFGKEIQKTIDLYFDKIGTDGIFWDEMNSSMIEYHYGSPWDQCSGDIDLKTHEVIGLKSSVELISKPWRLQIAKDILKRGFLVGNGFPLCEEIIKLHFPCFTESAQSSFAARTHLYSPVVLGDHLSEINELDAYRDMLKALDYGCVYYWYAGKLVPTHETLTSKMFPITPIELGPGYIIGQERIITRVSGFFGWDDSSEHEVFFFNENGMPLSEQKVKTKIVDGKKLSEISLWPDWSAVIVRKSVQ